MSDCIAWNVIQGASSLCSVLRNQGGGAGRSVRPFGSDVRLHLSTCVEALPFGMTDLRQSSIDLQDVRREGGGTSDVT